MNSETIKNFNGVSYISYESLERTGLVRHGFMTRKGGVSTGCYESLDLGFNRGDEPEKVKENFDRAAACFDIKKDSIVMAHQTHTAVIRKVTNEDAGKGVTRERDYSDVDGLITNVPGIMLATSHADCTPVFLLDPKSRAIGMVHSGWRGTVGLIGAEAVKSMSAEYGCLPEDIIAVIGPCICGACYEIGPEVAEQFIGIFGGEEYALTRKDNGKFMLDQKAANKRILKEAGIREENISVSELCTFEREELFYSHRRMGAERGQMLAFLGLI